LGLNRTDCGEHRVRNIAAPEKWRTTRCVDGDMEVSAGHTERAYPYQRTDQKGIVGFLSRSHDVGGMANVFLHASSLDAGMHDIEMHAWNDNNRPWMIVDSRHLIGEVEMRLRDGLELTGAAAPRTFQVNNSPYETCRVIAAAPYLSTLRARCSSISTIH
jgi:hypothetical protein